MNLTLDEKPSVTRDVEVTLEAKDSKKVLLRSIKKLELYTNQMTKGRRHPPVPQAYCADGEACDEFKPTMFTCTNVPKPREMLWDCHPLEKTDKFVVRVFKVSCEGYTSPKDKYILAGSCGLEYSVDLMSPTTGIFESALDIGMYLFFTVVACYIFYSFFFQYRSPRIPRSESESDTEPYTVRYEREEVTTTLR